MVRPSRTRHDPERPIRRYCRVCGMPRNLSFMDAARVPKGSVLDVCDVCVDTVVLTGRRVLGEEGFAEFLNDIRSFEKTKDPGGN